MLGSSRMCVQMELALFVRCMDHGDVLALIGRFVKLVVVVCFAPVLWAWSKDNVVVSNTAVTSQCEWLIPFPLLSDWKNE
jgi:hypothetical protein